MNSDNTRDAADPSPASAGSQDAEKFKRAYKAMYRVAEVHISQIAELRAELLQARMQPTLTDEEREAIEWSMEEANSERYATLRNLLERTK